MVYSLGIKQYWVQDRFLLLFEFSFEVIFFFKFLFIKVRLSFFCCGQSYDFSVRYLDFFFLLQFSNYRGFVRYKLQGKDRVSEWESIDLEQFIYEILKEN